MLKLHDHHKKPFFIAMMTTVGLGLLFWVAVPDSYGPGASAEPGKGKGEIEEFEYGFSGDFVLSEIHPESESPNADWWLNSGAYMTEGGGVGETVQGELSIFDPRWDWYSKNNPAETDNGFHPQNIFRLISRHSFGDSSQEAYFRMNRYNLSLDPHRTGSNGLLLMSRYQDGDNLYYSGLRVDGRVIVKKKINGQYYSMFARTVLSGGPYDRESNPNLIPEGSWIGIKTETKNGNNGSVGISVYLDIGRTGNWLLAAEVTDDGVSYGGPAFFGGGRGGVRTDFMDASFDDYRVVGMRAGTADSRGKGHSKK